MKTLLNLSLILIVNLATAQTVTIDTISYEQMNNLEISKTIRISTQINAFELEDGSFIAVGDTLFIGQPSRDQNQYNAYTKQMTNQFTTIMAGTAGGAMLKGINWLDESFSGKEVRVAKLTLSRLNKKHPLGVRIRLQGFNKTNFGLDKYATAFNGSIYCGELINPNAPISREEAIAKLKEAKDLVDLGLMSKEDFEKLKKELTPLIL